MNLTNEELQIKVAEYLGWKDCKRILWNEETQQFDTVTSEIFVLSGAPPWAKTARAEVPNYPEDLNACHEMEASMNEYQCAHYEDVVYKLWKLGEATIYADGMRCHIPARTRCEAFVQVRENI